MIRHVRLRLRFASNIFKLFRSIRALATTPEITSTKKTNTKKGPKYRRIRRCLRISNLLSAGKYARELPLIDLSTAARNPKTLVGIISETYSHS